MSRNPSRFPLVVGVAMLASTATVRAQGVPPELTRPGDTLKVWAEAPILNGVRAVVEGSRPDTIFFSVWSTSSRAWLHTPVGREQVTRLAVHDQPRVSKSRTVLGVVSGVAIGGAAGATMVYTLYQWSCPTPKNDCADRKGLASAGFVAVGVPGGIIGGILGGRPMLSWRRIFTRPE